MLFNVPEDSPESLNICSLTWYGADEADQKKKPQLLVSRAFSGRKVVDYLARMAAIPVLAASSNMNPALLATIAFPPLDAAADDNPFGSALQPWLAEATLFIDGKPYLHNRWLGKGATGTVALYLRGRHLEEQCVVKRMVDATKHEVLEAFATEYRLLREFKNRVADPVYPWREARLAQVIPRLVTPTAGRAWDKTHICIQPLCKRLKVNAANYVTIVEDLVDAVHLAALAGLVHRDVRPANLMMDTNACNCTAWPNLHHHAVLLDWGFALELDPGRSYSALAPYSGTVSCASQRILELFEAGKIYIKSGYVDNAESLVKALWRIAFPELSPPSEVLAQDENNDSVNKQVAAWWRKYWAKVERNVLPFKAAILAARRCEQANDADFKSLKMTIKDMLVVFVGGRLEEV